MLLPFLLAAAILVTTYLYNKLRYKRFQQYADFPQVPPSLLLGHLKILSDHSKRHEADAHPELGIQDMHQSIGQPPIMLMDIRPIGRPLVVVGSHEVAEQVAKASAVFPYSAPKGPSYRDRLSYMLGKTSILSAEGEHWKHLRRRFNPGFAPQYLGTFIPEICDKGVLFLDRLDARVKSGEAFTLLDLTMHLTFDVIGKIVLETDLDAQHDDRARRCELIRVYEDLLSEYNGETQNPPWWMTPMKVMRRAAIAKRLHTLLKDIVRAKYDDLHGKAASITGEKKKPARSVLSLSLQDVPTLTAEILDETADQLRTFLFAGHDTTSISISWVFYELSRTPHALKAVRAELNNLFGPEDPGDSVASIRDRLLARQDLLQRMPYVNAVIKEALRLHPPAGTARYIPPGTGFYVRTPEGKECCWDGLLFYISQMIIQKDSKVYGETAEEFLPERWLDEKSDTIPAGAWRPFERGPRNCIGQEVAMIETRLIVALAVRRYDFVKVGLGEVALDEKTGRPTLDPKRGGRQYLVAGELYSTRQVTAKPVDWMMIKVKRASADSID